MTAVSIFLPWLLFVPAIGTFALAPSLLDSYTWCCSVEHFKQKPVMIEVRRLFFFWFFPHDCDYFSYLFISCNRVKVLRKQKHDKIVGIVRSLTTLSFFVDQAVLPVNQIKFIRPSDFLVLWSVPENTWWPFSFFRLKWCKNFRLPVKAGVRKAFLKSMSRDGRYKTKGATLIVSDNFNHSEDRQGVLGT